MTPLGFWQRDADDCEFPHPATFVDVQWKSTVQSVYDSVVLPYLRGRFHDLVFLESYELGYSFCRFGCDVGKEMGACTLTDGVYYWPEGFAHYVDVHDVALPKEFLHHILAQHSMHRITSSPLKLWDSARQTPEPMPRELQQWLLEHTGVQ